MVKDNLLDELIIWLNKRPYWIINAINKTLTSGKRIEEKDFEILTKECLKEANTKSPKQIKIDENTFISYFNPKSSIGKVRLNSISKIRGINNLNPKNPLNFGDENLCIIYGRNGSGKSGYSRILKKACGAKKTEELICNVFEGKKHQECTFNVTIGQKEKIIKWQPKDKLNQALKTIDIFDTSSGLSYIIEENEVTYEPALLRFISYISFLATKVSESLSNDLSRLKLEKPIAPNQFESAKLIDKFDSIDSQKTFKKQFGNLNWTKSKRKSIDSLKVKLANKDNTLIIKSLENKIESLENILENFKGDSNLFSATKFKNKKSILSKIAIKQKEVDQVSKLIKGQKINNVPSDLWREMWEAAREFSNEMVYTETDFPNTENNSKCILCQQDLNDQTKVRLNSLEEFVNNKKNEELELLEDDLKEFHELYQNAIDKELIDQYLTQAGLTKKLENRIRKRFDEIEILKKYYVSLTKKSKLKLLSRISLETELKIILGKTKKEYSSYLKAKSKEETDKINQEILDLGFEEWLFNQKEALDTYSSELAKSEKINNAKTLCSTKAYSIKKSTLSEKLVSEDFIKRFDSELKQLGAGHLKVTIEKTKVSKSKVYHQIKLRGSVINERIENVLSEGEFRVISLAAFLADVSEKEFDSPFIFDDPISSLDVDYEEKTVKRLIELAKKRQVIIFTHRLSFLSLLNDEVKNQKTKANNVSVISEHWGKGQPSKPLLNSQRPDKALNVLITDRLPKALKTLKSEGTAEYLPKAKSICSDFRIQLERIVEFYLLNQIVMRYRRSISTKGMMQNLVKINDDDVILIEKMMTKYSAYEHSQSREIPNTPIDPEELKEDMEEVSLWIKDFVKR